MTQDELITLIELMPHRELMLWIKARVSLQDYTYACQLCMDVLLQRVGSFVEYLDLPADQKPENITPEYLSQYLQQQVLVDPSQREALRIVLQQGMLDSFDILVDRYKLNLDE